MNDLHSSIVSKWEIPSICRKAADDDFYNMRENADCDFDIQGSSSSEKDIPWSSCWIALIPIDRVGTFRGTKGND